MATAHEPGTSVTTTHAADENYLTASHGLKSWLITLDHKRIGMMYLMGVMGAFFLGGIFALLLRAELFLGTPNTIFFDIKFLEMSAADVYNHMFTLHGAVMTFLFIIPSVPAALGNFVLPIMIGAKDVAFPRMNLCSFYLWIAGAILFLLAIALGGLDTGWTFYAPYSTTTNFGGVFAALMGAFVLGFSSIFTGLNFIVTLHTMRPPGMTWFKMPLFLWAIYATAIIQLLATPVLGITVLLLAVERVLHIGIFDPAYGGDPVLFQHFFWFYSHPAVYIMILPAMGIISELISTFSRKHIFGYTFIAYSSLAIAIFGFLVWGHHMFTSSSELGAAVFSLLTFSVSIPSAIKVFNWLATMYKGSIDLRTPMIYAVAFIFLFTIGGLTGLFLGTLATDIHLHDTYFVVAHFHYVMMGGTLVAFLGGVHYWWPKMTGKMYDEKWASIWALSILVFFNLTFFPQFIMGSRGMPRRYYNYVEEYQIYHQLSTIGAFLMGISLVCAAVVLIRSLKNGKQAPANPWGAATLEWKCSSPPPHNNFDHAPVVGDPYDMQSVVYDPAIEGFVDREPGSYESAH
ncbi:MAG: cbb3-type cytochrome c oxidase subunit I [Planctomycetaceae bacterium]